MTTGPMLPTTRLDIDVEALVDDTWWPGNLEHWRQADDGRWQAWVRWTTGPGANRVGWYDQERLRRPDS